MLALKKFAAVMAGALVMAFVGAGHADAGTRGGKDVSIEFRYQAGESVEQNYSNFYRKARHACEGHGVRDLHVLQLERQCVVSILDQVVAKFARNDLAGVHTARTGRDVRFDRNYALLSAG